LIVCEVPFGPLVAPYDACSLSAAERVETVHFQQANDIFRAPLQ
jgi:hypothetical protein